MLRDNIRRLRRPDGDDAAPGRRWKTNWPAEVRLAAERRSCVVLDISSWGAQLQLDAPPEEQSQIWLVIENIGNMAARVVWRRERNIGIQFLEQQVWIRRLHMQRLDPASWSPRGEGQAQP